MKHLILAHATDLHGQHMLAELRQRGHEAYLLETQRFPTEIQISFAPNQGTGSICLPDGEQLAFDTIESVYWRNFCGVAHETSKATRGSVTDIAYYDSMACLRSWFGVRNRTHWLNSWAAYQFHQEKPLQLHAVAQLGVKVPHTYIGNDAQQILAFCADEPQAIFKPVYGGAHTERITAHHLAGAHMASALTQAPITLQKFIEGSNVRTYAIGQQLYSVELISDETDFRSDQDLQVRCIDTPEHIQAQVFAIMQALSLNWTAIDWRRTPNGEYYFLEANPSPMFLAMERISGLPLTATLIAAMTGHAWARPRA
jgi:hypothetical protein